MGKTVETPFWMACERMNEMSKKQIWFHGPLWKSMEILQNLRKIS